MKSKFKLLSVSLSNLVQILSLVFAADPCDQFAERKAVCYVYCIILCHLGARQYQLQPLEMLKPKDLPNPIGG
jgi:hypothetical protein